VTLASYWPHLCAICVNGLKVVDIPLLLLVSLFGLVVIRYFTHDVVMFSEYLSGLNCLVH